MKKIVALVLALVMVMGLATVASAASYSKETKMGATTTVAAADKYAVYEADTTAKTALVVASYTALSTETVTQDGKTTTGYIPAYYKTSDGKFLYEVATAASADYRIFKNDAFVTYVKEAVEVTDFVTRAATYVEKAKGCGNYAVDVYVVDGTAYAASDVGTSAILNGKYVYLGAETQKTSHLFNNDSTFTYKSVNDKTVVGITCVNCKANFQVVDAIPASYTGAVNGVALAPQIILLDAATASAGTTTETVESAQTFDAGIAMYVGMSVMAAAGSAVVLKKKD